MSTLDAFEITVHVQRDVGRCFKVTSAQFDLALTWLDSRNIPLISLDRKGKKELECVCCGDLEAATDIGSPEASIHCEKGKCLSIPISVETAKGILAEFIERPEVCKIEIWCKGMEDSDLGVCECLGWVEDGLREIAEEDKEKK